MFSLPLWVLEPPWTRGLPSHYLGHPSFSSRHHDSQPKEPRTRRLTWSWLDLPTSAHFLSLREFKQDLNYIAFQFQNHRLETQELLKYEAIAFLSLRNTNLNDHLSLPHPREIIFRSQIRKHLRSRTREPRRNHQCSSRSWPTERESDNWVGQRWRGSS